jgi:hypothetical protein
MGGQILILSGDKIKKKNKKNLKQTIKIIRTIIDI